MGRSTADLAAVMKIWLSDGALVERLDPFSGPVMPFRQEIFDSKGPLKVLVTDEHIVLLFD